MPKLTSLFHRGKQLHRIMALFENDVEFSGIFAQHPGIFKTPKSQRIEKCPHFYSEIANSPLFLDSG